PPAACVWWGGESAGGGSGRQTGRARWVMPSVNVEAETAALVAELPSARLAGVPDAVVSVAGYRVPLTRPALVGEGVTFARRLRLGRLLLAAALESGSIR